MQKLGINIVDDAGLVLPGDAENLVDNTARGFPGRQLRRQVESRPQCILPRRGFLLAQNTVGGPSRISVAPRVRRISAALSASVSYPRSGLKWQSVKNGSAVSRMGKRLVRTNRKTVFCASLSSSTGCFANGKARDPNQAPDAEQILQLLAEPSSGNFHSKRGTRFADIGTICRTWPIQS